MSEVFFHLPAFSRFSGIFWSSESIELGLFGSMNLPPVSAFTPMKLQQDTIKLSATDLANHLSCRHLTALNLRLAKGEIAEPAWANPHTRVLQQRGLEHEKAYIQSLRARGLAVVDLSAEPAETANQASLASDEWRGRADVLLRVEASDNPTRLGNWSYEVVDCKLARETKAETILQ